MNWEQACAHPSLKDMPFKIELDEYGKIIMNAVRVSHALYQGEIEFLLRSLLKKGKTFPECAIKTRKGTKVADVAWASPETVFRIKYEIQCSVAPEICVEVLSLTNTHEEMEEKKALYFESGAKEVWLCEDGRMFFCNRNGMLKKSVMVPDFPDMVEI
ncbi:MAG: Uma2 family endonuclease [Desulfobacterales bacterium]